MQRLLIEIGVQFSQDLEETLRLIYKIDHVYAIKPYSVELEIGSYHDS